jgi:MoaA/NifB/PqqE/SkfB family radical SAM enzyme
MDHLNRGMKEALGKLAGKAYLARVRGDGRPFAIGHFITHRCICSCKSCLWKHNDWDDLPFEELERFYREAADLGFAAAAFTGGEPFLRKDLGQLVQLLKQELGMTLLVFTTGWLLEKRMDQVLPHIDMLMVSVDSANPARHDEIRGVEGLFERMRAGVREARARYPELVIHFNCCVQRGVTEEIDDLIALATNEGVHISFDVITESRNGADGGAFTETEMGLPLPELQRVCQQLLQRKRDGAPILNSENYLGYFAAGRPGYRCHLPKLVMMVDGRGNVENCLNLDEPLANIRDLPLKEILELPRFKQLRVDAEGCSSCSSPTMVDLSCVWENPQLVFEKNGLALL